MGWASKSKEVEGVGFGVEGVGCRVEGVGCGVYSSVFRFSGGGLSMWVLEFRVQGSGFRV